MDSRRKLNLENWGAQRAKGGKYGVKKSSQMIMQMATKIL